MVGVVGDHGSLRVRDDIVDLEADQNKLVVMSSQGLDHRAAGCLAIVTALCAVLQLGIIEFVAFGTAILTSFRAHRAGMKHERASPGDEGSGEIAERGAVGD